MEYRVLSFSPTFLTEVQRLEFERNIEHTIDNHAKDGWRIISVIAVGMIPFVFMERETH